MAQQNTVKCGSFSFEWGTTITEMDDSTHFLNNLPALRSKLRDDGYILLRNQIDTDLIDNALQVITKSLHETWHCIDIDDERVINDLFVKTESSGILLTGYKPITHNKSVLCLLHCNKLISLMSDIFNTEPITLDTKWVRVKGINEFTDEHSDYYRFAGSCHNMLTVWMPLINVPIQRGPLAICPKSHCLNFPIKTNYDYGVEMDQQNDIELPSDFSEFNKTAIWKSTNFNKGDLLIFDIRTIHASLTNKTNKFRISIDTRWQPKHSVLFWNDTFIRFEQFKQNKNKQNHDNDDDDNEGKKDDMDLMDIMMDCTFTESDNDVIDSSDFEQISKRLMLNKKSLSYINNNYNNNDQNESRSSFV